MKCSRAGPSPNPGAVLTQGGARRFPRADAVIVRPAMIAEPLVSYWLGVYPLISRELRQWHKRARAIPDPALRRLALDALAKRGNMEGAAAFAALVPYRHRGAVVRATVAFQTAYNHLDALSEQPGAGRVENARRLHQALLAALDASEDRKPSAPQLDYYACDGKRDDGGYLTGLVRACRTSCSTLPSYSLVAAAARRAAERVVEFQSLNQGYTQGDHEALERWARAQTPAGSGLRWWETAASAGSSLGVHVMLAAAGSRELSPTRVKALEHAYFPWIGALHSMLDQLIDTAEDARTGQRNLTCYYASPREMVERMGWLAERSLEWAAELPPAGRHVLIVAAMASFYLSAPEASMPIAVPAAHAVLEAIGPPARPTMAVFKARRTASRVYYAWRQPQSIIWSSSVGPRLMRTLRSIGL